MVLVGLSWTFKGFDHNVVDVRDTDYFGTLAHGKMIYSEKSQGICVWLIWTSAATEWGQ